MSSLTIPTILKVFLYYWRPLFVILVPLILSPLLFIDGEENGDENEEEEVEKNSQKFQCAWVILIMALYWVVEVVPLAMTSFLPVVLLPLLGIQSTGDVTINYMKETNMMFISGLVISMSVQYSNLHRKIALRILTLVGSSLLKLTLGIMLTTMFLSMWMINSAATSMMIPIIAAVLEELEKSISTVHEDPVVNSTVVIVDDETGNSNKGIEYSLDKSRGVIRKKQMMLLGICHGSNLGGSMVVTGTTPNLVTMEFIKQLNFSQNGKYVDLTFATWIAYAAPPGLLNVIIVWFYLTTIFMGVPIKPHKMIKNLWVKTSPEKEQMKKLKREEYHEKEKRIKARLQSDYKKLGPMTFHQGAVLCSFIVVIMLWLFRDPRFTTGWQEALFSGNPPIADSTAALLIAFALFVIPKEPSFWSKNGVKKTSPGPLLDWKFVQQNLPWDIWLLMGSGFAISDASQKSGLSSWVGEQLNGLQSLPNPLILIIVMIITTAVTEILSNAAAANLIIPILLSLSKRLGLHPLYLTLPACICCSFAFMLPVSAPSNGLIYAAAGGDMTIFNMVKAGFGLNIICTGVHFLMHITYGNLLFDFNNFEYAPEPNVTRIRLNSFNVSLRNKYIL